MKEAVNFSICEPLASRRAAGLSFVKFFAGGKPGTLPRAPRAAIVEDGDGVARISPDIELSSVVQDAALKRLIDSVLRR